MGRPIFNSFRTEMKPVDQVPSLLSRRKHLTLTFPSAVG